MVSLIQALNRLRKGAVCIVLLLGVVFYLELLVGAKGTVRILS